MKAIKAKPFTKYADVPILGKWKRLTEENSEDAIDWFGDLAASEISKLITGPLTLIPLPNSSSTVANAKTPRTALLARSIASKLSKATVWDGMRWIEAKPATHQEGTRIAQELYDNLKLTHTVPKGTIVLVDDIYTKGGHLQAAVARLAEKRAACSLAVCAGRTVLESPDNPFEVVVAEIEDFRPHK